MSFFEHIFSDSEDDNSGSLELTGNLESDLSNILFAQFISRDKTILNLGNLKCVLKRKSALSLRLDSRNDVTTVTYLSGVWHFVPRDNFERSYLYVVPEPDKIKIKIEFSLSLLRLWTILSQYDHLPKYIANETNPEMAGECIKNGGFSLGIHHPWHGFPQQRYRVGFATESIEKLKSVTYERLLELYSRLEH